MGELQLNKSEKKFLIRSRKYRVRNILFRAGAIFAVIGISITGTIVSYSFFKDSQKSLGIAEKQTQRAEDSSRVAIQQRQIALDSAESAIASRQLALIKAQEAEDSAEVAIIQREIAQMEQKRAEDSAAVAIIQREIAQKEQKRAEDSARVAQEQRGVAQEQTQIAMEETRQANLLAASAVASTSRAQDIFNKYIKAFLARQAFEIHSENGGSTFDTTMYQALYAAQTVLQEGDQRYNHLFQGEQGSGIQKVNAKFSQGKAYFITLDGLLGVQRINGGKLISQYPFGVGTLLTALAISSNNKWLAIGGNQEIRVYDLSQGNFQKYRSFKNHDTYVNDIHFVPGKEEFISVGKDKKVILQQLSQSDPSYSKTLQKELVAFDVSEDGAYILGITRQGSLTRISELTSSPKEEGVSLPGRAKFSCISFSPSTKKWAAGATNGKVYLWKSFQPHRAQSLTRHLASVNDIQFSPTGSFLASSGNDGAVHLWKLSNTRELPLILRDHPDFAMGVDFDSNTSHLVVGCWNGLLKKWPLSLIELSKGICDKVAGKVSEAEWTQYLPSIDRADKSFQPACDLSQTSR